MPRTVEAFKLSARIEIDGAPRANRELRDLDRNANGARSSLALLSKMRGALSGGLNIAAGAADGGIMGGVGEGLKMLPGLGTLATAVMKVTGAVQSGVKVGFDYNRVLEENTIAFETFLKSGEKARKFIGEVARASESSSYEFPDLLDAAKRARGYGFAIGDTIPVVQDATDAARGYGGEMLGIIRAWGQMRQRGKLSMEEVNQLLDQNIPVWEYLADGVAKVDKAFGKLTRDEQLQKLQKLTEQGRISGKGAVEAIRAGLRRDVGGLDARFATETAAGLEANLSDVATRLAGTASGPAFEKYKQTLRGLLGAANSEAAASLARGVAGGSDKVFGAFEAAVKEVPVIGANIKAGVLEGAAGTGLQLAADAINDFKTGIDSHSPAKKFIPLGYSAGEGFMLGFREAIGAHGGVMGAFQNKDARALGGGSEREQIERIAQIPIVRKFFEAIRRAEGGKPGLVVGGKITTGLDRHPNIVGLRTSKGPSTAWGNYQITGSNWYGTRRAKGLKERLGLTDAKEHSQLLAAIQLFKDRDGGKGLSALLNGDVFGAMRVARKDWQSLPASTLGGRNISVERFMSFFDGASGTSALPVRVVGGDGAAAQPYNGHMPGVEPYFAGLYEHINKNLRKGETLDDVMSSGRYAAFKRGYDEMLARMRPRDGERVTTMSAQTQGGENRSDAFAEFDWRGFDAAQWDTTKLVPNLPLFDTQNLQTAALLIPQIVEPFTKEKFDEQLLASQLALIGMAPPIENAATAAGKLNDELAQTEPIIMRVKREADFLGITMSDAAGLFQTGFEEALTATEGTFKERANGMLSYWLQSIQQMLAASASAKLSEVLFGAPSDSSGSGSGGGRGLLGSLINFGVGLFTSGLSFGGGGASAGAAASRAGGFSFLSSSGGATSAAAGRAAGFNFGGFRAKGGPVEAGRAYVVGERRPELFIPDRSGVIRSSVPESGNTGGKSGGDTYNVSMTVNGVQSPRDFARSEDQIVSSMRRKLARSGRNS